MELHIESDENLNLDDFCRWLLIRMKEYLLINIDIRKLVYFDDYINSENIIRWRSEKLKKALSCKEILLAGIDNLTIDQNNNSYTIRLNPNTFIPNTYAKFINIINLITYGNLVLFGYPIYDEMMKFFADNLQSFYQTYIEEM